MLPVLLVATEACLSLVALGLRVDVLVWTLQRGFLCVSLADAGSETWPTAAFGLSAGGGDSLSPLDAGPAVSTKAVTKSGQVGVTAATVHFG